MITFFILVPTIRQRVPPVFVKKKFQPNMSTHVMKFSNFRQLRLDKISLIGDCSKDEDESKKRYWAAAINSPQTTILRPITSRVVV